MQFGFYDFDEGGNEDFVSYFLNLMWKEQDGKEYVGLISWLVFRLG